MKKIFIAGALSAIAQETARCFAAEGAALFLAARDAKKLEMSADDLRARGASFVGFAVADFDQVDQHQALIQHADSVLQGMDAALIAYGYLPEQEACEKDFNLVRRTFETNLMSVISLVMVLAPLFAARQTGTLAVIGSVAGDRGRYKNYVYGAAKGALALYLQGVRARLSRSGVHVLTIKPGFVDTPMTAGMKKNLLFADSALIGRLIHRAMHSHKDILYAPWFWRWILFVVCAIPEGVFKKLKI